jgi:hypothetical protein
MAVLTQTLKALIYEVLGGMAKPCPSFRELFPQRVVFEGQYLYARQHGAIEYPARPYWLLSHSRWEVAEES